MVVVAVAVGEVGDLPRNSHTDPFPRRRLNLWTYIHRRHRAAGMSFRQVRDNWPPRGSGGGGDGPGDYFLASSGVGGRSVPDLLLLHTPCSSSVTYRPLQPSVTALRAPPKNPNLSVACRCDTASLPSCAPQLINPLSRPRPLLPTVHPHTYAHTHTHTHTHTHCLTPLPRLLLPTVHIHTHTHTPCLTLRPTPHPAFVHTPPL